MLDGVAWRATRTPNGLATARLQVTPDGRLRVDAWGDGAEWVLQKAPAWCGAHDDVTDFQPDHPIVRDLARRHPGLRIGRTEAVYEAALGIALEQRVATREAWQNWQSLVRALGEPAPGPLPGLRVPPSPLRLVRTPA